VRDSVRGAFRPRKRYDQVAFQSLGLHQAPAVEQIEQIAQVLDEFDDGGLRVPGESGTFRFLSMADGLLARGALSRRNPLRRMTPRATVLTLDARSCIAARRVYEARKRYSPGGTPVQRLNARVKAEISENPSR